MKLAILGVIAFVAALAGGTGFGIATAPKPKPAPAVSAPAAKPAPAPAPAPAAVAASATPQGPPVQSVAPLSDSSHVAAAWRAANAAPAERAAAPPKPATPEDYGAIAKILSDMKPKQANEILSHLSDDEVEGILRTVAARSAAVLLAQMPAARAAEMSRRLMQPKGAK